MNREEAERLLRWGAEQMGRGVVDDDDPGAQAALQAAADRLEREANDGQ